MNSLSLVKKTVLLLLCALLCLLVCSCMLADAILNNEETLAQQQIKQILDSIETKDAPRLRSVFAESVLDDVENMDRSITDLFAYMDTAVLSYEDWGGPTVHTSRENGETRKVFWMTVDVKTKTEPYRLAIKLVAQDTATPEQVGVHSLYVIKTAEDHSQEYAYWGDGKDTAGIQIGIKNEAMRDQMEDEELCIDMRSSSVF